MWKTVLALLVTIIVIPILAFTMDEPVTAFQKEILIDLVIVYLAVALLVTAWGFRLTYNFSRRGGYSIKFWTGTEDYRWAVLQAKPEFAARWKRTLFNFLFLSIRWD
ncbi:MAG: hypothetical protein U9R49_07420 [Bacteroidota bacterium]|nr:hypothetical protein [Bacteroidota bacterium]